MCDAVCVFWVESTASAAESLLTGACRSDPASQVTQRPLWPPYQGQSSLPLHTSSVDARCLVAGCQFLVHIYRPTECARSLHPHSNVRSLILGNLRIFRCCFEEPIGLHVILHESDIDCCDTMSHFVVTVISYYLREGGNVFTLSVCLCTKLLKKFLTDFDEIFRIARQWYKEQSIKFWGWSGSPFRRSTGKCNAAFLTIISGLQSDARTQSNWVTWCSLTCKWNTVQARSRDQATLLQLL